MSKKKLSTVMEGVIKKLENSKKYIREGIADKNAQKLTISNIMLSGEIQSFLSDKRFQIDPNQRAEINKAVQTFCNEAFSTFSTKKNYKATVAGTPNEFSIYVEQDGATGSVFKLALRQQLNPYLEKLERTVAQIVGGEEKQFVRGIKNDSGVSTTKGFLNLGHTDGSSISKVGPSIVLTPKEKITLNKNYYEELYVALTKYSFFDSGPAFMELELERSSQNFSTSAKEEKGRFQAIAKELKTIMSQIDVANIEGSPSLVQEIQQSLVAAGTGKKFKKTAKSKVSTKKKIKTKVRESRLTINPSGNAPEERNWLSILALINARLPSAVASNMGSPGLNYRTGAFAESTRATDIQMTPQGFPSIGITYDKNPYGVFDRSTGASPWNTPERDPHTLIEKSLRQIAQDIIKERFYVRRV